MALFALMLAALVAPSVATDTVHVETYKKVMSHSEFINLLSTNQKVCPDCKQPKCEPIKCKNKICDMCPRCATFKPPKACKCDCPNQKCQKCELSIPEPCPKCGCPPPLPCAMPKCAEPFCPQIACPAPPECPGCPVLEPCPELDCPAIEPCAPCKICQKKEGPNIKPPPSVGGTKDEYGCRASAGELYCESLKQCIRSWETVCPKEKKKNSGEGKPEPEQRPKICCKAMTPSCLGCQQGLSADEYCEKAKTGSDKEKEICGISEEAKAPEKAKKVKEAPNATTLVGADACCTEGNAECEACKAKRSVDDICKDRVREKSAQAAQMACAYPGCDKSSFCQKMKSDASAAMEDLFNHRSLSSFVELASSLEASDDLQQQKVEQEDPNCKDDPSFLDAHRYSCKEWRGYDCHLAADSQYSVEEASMGYTQAEEDEILDKCKFTCGNCPKTLNLHGRHLTHKPVIDPPPVEIMCPTCIVEPCATEEDICGAPKACPSCSKCPEPVEQPCLCACPALAPCPQCPVEDSPFCPTCDCAVQACPQVKCPTIDCPPMQTCPSCECPMMKCPIQLCPALACPQVKCHACRKPICSSDEEIVDGPMGAVEIVEPPSWPAWI